MRRAVIVANERADHQKSWGGAFSQGLRRHGWEVRVQSHPDACDLLVMWGTRKKFAIDTQKQVGGEVVILERGYLLDRFEWTSVSFGGGLNNRGIFRGPFHDGSRWERHFAHLMQPWRLLDSRRGYALIIGQVPGDMSLGGKDLQPWYESKSFHLHNMGWSVRFRPHPVAVERRQVLPVRGAPTIGGTLQAALAGAGMVVTWNSNTGVESVLAGVPTISADCGSMAWTVTGHELGEIVTPDRTAWAHKMAWCQYQRDELESGFAWEAMGAGACATAA
jgi:hypothetical protein